MELQTLKGTIEFKNVVRSLKHFIVEGRVYQGMLKGKGWAECPVSVLTREEIQNAIDFDESKDRVLAKFDQRNAERKLNKEREIAKKDAEREQQRAMKALADRLLSVPGQVQTERQIVYVCTKCGSEYRTKEELLSCVKCKPYICEDCGKSFKTMQTLKMHGKKHK